MVPNARRIARGQVDLVFALVLTFSLPLANLQQRPRQDVKCDQWDVRDALKDIEVEHTAIAVKWDEQAFAWGKRNGHALAFVLPHLRPGEQRNHVQAGPETRGQEGTDHPPQQAKLLLGEAVGRVERGLTRAPARKPQLRCQT